MIQFKLTQWLFTRSQNAHKMCSSNFVTNSTELKFSWRRQPQRRMQYLIDILIMQCVNVIENDIEIKQTSYQFRERKLQMKILLWERKFEWQKCDWQTGANIHCRTINWYFQVVLLPQAFRASTSNCFKFFANWTLWKQTRTQSEKTFIDVNNLWRWKRKRKIYTDVINQEQKGSKLNQCLRSFLLENADRLRDWDYE